MTPLSTRYVAALFALLLPAAVAVWSYTYGEFRSDDCADTSALLENGWTQEIERRGGPDGRPEPWVLQNIGGTVATKARFIGPLRVRMVRSFALERLYEKPLRFVYGAHDHASYQPTLEWIGSQGQELPVYKASAEAEGLARLSAYMFLYDSRPMVDPALGLLAAAFRRATTGRRPLTLLTVSVAFSTSAREAAERLVDQWLISAYEHYSSSCRM